MADPATAANTVTFRPAGSSVRLSPDVQADRVGAVVGPTSGGGLAVAMANLGIEPSFPPGRVESSVTSPVIDRRPSQLVICSAPTAVVRSFDEQGPAGLWQFVCQDEAGVWVPLTQIPGMSDPQKAVREDFKDVPEARRDDVRRQAFRAIRLDPEQFPPRQSPILRQAVRPDGQAEEVAVVGSFARQVDADRWVNVQTRLGPTSIDQERGVLMFADRIGRVQPSPSPTFDKSFLAVDATSIRVRFSVESASDGERELYVRGFSRVGGSVLGVPLATALGWMRGYRPETAVYCQPDLRLIRLNGQPANVAGLDGRAAAVAESLVGTEQAARVVTIEGYLPVEIGGRVSGVRYQVRGRRTVVEIDGYHSPAPPVDAVRPTEPGGGYGGQGGAGRSAVVSSSPAVSDDPRPSRRPADTYHAATERARPRQSQLGEGREAQPRVQVAPVPSSPPTDLVRVEITARRTQAGRYNARVRTGPLPADVGQALTVAATGTQGQTCVVSCLSDAGTGEHSLEVGRVYQGVVAGRATSGSSDLGLHVLVSGGGGGPRWRTGPTFLS